MPHVVVNAEQRGAGWDFAFQGPPHSCCISTRQCSHPKKLQQFYFQVRLQQHWGSLWACTVPKIEVQNSAHMGQVLQSWSCQEMGILDVTVQSESCCHPVGWQWLESAKILAQNCCKHPRQDGRPLKWPWKCSLQRGAVTEHRAVPQPQKTLTIKVLLIFKKCISSPHNPSLKD